MIKMTPRPYKATALFRLLDDGHGGWLQTAKRHLKFNIRHWLCRRKLAQIRQYFDARDLRGVMTHHDLPLMLRPMRSYLWRSLNAQKRTDAMLSHFDWLTTHISAPVIRDFYAQGIIELYTQECPEGVISIDLQPGRALGREGEMELHLKLNKITVMKAALSVLAHTHLRGGHPGDMLVIGNIQGQRQAQQEIKVVTQRLERTRPHNILLTAFQALVSGWQLTDLLGVADHEHAYSGYRSLSRRVGQNYDAIWKELGAEVLVGKSHWRLPMEWVPRSEQDVASSKRSQLRRKNEIRQKIFDQVAARAAALFK
jgi:uncharacterized protein VirK/YbjX